MVTARRYCILTLGIIFLCPAIVFSQIDLLREKIEEIVKMANGNVGVCIRDFKDHKTFVLNGHDRFPMQSVYKFPVALMVLNQIDKGKYSLNQKIHVKNSELLQNTWSPLRDKYPSGDVDITLDELLTYTISKSDNNGCDFLFRMVGGPSAVNEYIHNLGITDIAIVSTEEEMHREWSIQFRNWCTPVAMGELLEKFSCDSILSEKSREYLWYLLVNTDTGANRIKGKLPAGSVVAHKTGSSGTDEHGVAAATNDVGIIVLPSGRRLGIVIFISNSTAEENVRDEVIAKIARIAWDSYSRH